MFSKYGVFDSACNPRNVALVSVALIPLFFCLWLMAPESATLQQAQAWATISMVGSLAFMLVSSALVHRTLVHSYIFFLGCTALFIGGRFIAYAMGFDVAMLKMESNFFSVHRPDFVSIELTAREGLRLTLYLVTCLHAMHAGYMFSLWKKPVSVAPRQDLQWTSSLLIPAIALASVSALAFMVSFPDAYRAVHNNGYVALYGSASADFTTRGSTAAQYGLLLALGLAFASRNKWLGWCVLGLLAIYYTANLQLGVRGGIMGFVLLCAWLFHTKIRRIDRIALLAIPLLLGGVVVMAAMGTRGIDFGASKALLLPWFIDNQGLTALYIHSALQIEHYPALAYVHGVLPITPMLAALNGTSIPLDQLYFGQYLSKAVLAGDAYQKGFGMGWSLFADFYAFTLWVPGAYLIAAATFGALLARLVNATHPLVFGAHVMIFVKLMLLPRTGLYSVIPFLLVYAGIVVACYIGSRLWRRRLGQV
ncbi:O-antigen polysaccharide polymerase Wzy [Pseudomonas sp. S37]|uniref:O-antigen polysaccharide polymerase Wzy n=1 Tax=Pseudomonas sp. S37 TaxID=2767449 RepID=UPI00191144AE|nr:O-antigen polysaccharide polymerase Wzy [Pseudomonas sp. S37]MBK4995862.1 O-antigen polysaccharide polymerase Wzy [Pseudomonas sp. S37]